ncbi:sigma-70 family RNA polymerase sigma factor [Uniformispora flossi]|uniref:sigma-70 family RNA polymerase sigma factor n=1 Tax=Uniformispora flossi TaxID=3390723 RepID=UPI003C2FFF6D
MDAIAAPAPDADRPHPGDIWLAEQFETHRVHLRTVAYSMLGSRSDADDAVQEAWLRVTRADRADVVNLRAWLTTVVGRISLDMLRTRRSRREDYPGTSLPEPIVRMHDEPGPEEAAVAADSIGLALLIVLDTLNPAERLAFVLHDVFGMAFDEIAPIVSRTPAAARQLASRARRRVRSAPRPDTDLVRQRRIVDAFLAAARDGDFDALVGALAPDVRFQLDIGAHRLGAHAAAAHRTAPETTLVGADVVAKQMIEVGPQFLAQITPVIVNGSAGTLAGRLDRPGGVAGFTIVDGLIVRIDVIADPEKLRGIDLGGKAGEETGGTRA